MLNFVVEVSQSIGLGHAVRSRALALATGRESFFHVLGDWKHNRIESLLHPFSFKRYAHCEQIPSSGAGSDVWCVDVFSPCESFLRRISANRTILFGVSDHRCRFANAIVNVAEEGKLEPRRFRHEEWKCEIFEGLAYASLRPEFLEKRSRDYDPCGPILVALGGTNAAGLAVPVSHLIEQETEGDERKIQVLAGDESHTTNRIECLRFTDRVKDTLEAASLAVVAPGNLLIECLATQTPAICISQNMRQSRDFFSYPWLAEFESLEWISWLREPTLNREHWLKYAKRMSPGKHFNEIVAILES